MRRTVTTLAVVLLLAACGATAGPGDTLDVGGIDVTLIAVQADTGPVDTANCQTHDAGDTCHRATATWRVTNTSGHMYDSPELGGPLRLTLDANGRTWGTTVGATDTIGDLHLASGQTITGNTTHVVPDTATITGATAVNAEAQADWQL